MDSEKAKKISTTLRVISNYCAGVPWCVVGGVAVSIYAHRSPTDDLDILVGLDEEEFRPFLDRFRNLRFGIEDNISFGPRRPFVPPKAAKLFSFDPDFCDVDILATGRDPGLCASLLNAAPTCWLDYPVIFRPDLVAMKRAAGRPKDAADLALMEER